MWSLFQLFYSRHPSIIIVMYHCHLTYMNESLNLLDKNNDFVFPFLSSLEHVVLNFGPIVLKPAQNIHILIKSRQSSNLDHLWSQTKSFVGWVNQLKTF